MSYRIWNTALDHTKRFLHRRAHKMQMEPVLAGRRLRLRTSMVISDELFEHNKANLELYKRWGVVEWEQLGGGTKAVKDPSKEIPLLVPENITPAPVACDVLLTDAGDNHISVIKVLRENSSLELREVSDLLGMIPVTVLKGTNEIIADSLIAALTEAGAKAEKVRVPIVEKVPPQAETVPQQTKPQPKSPFKGKKQ